MDFEILIPSLNYTIIVIELSHLHLFNDDDNGVKRKTDCGMDTETNFSSFHIFTFYGMEKLH